MATVLKHHGVKGMHWGIRRYQNYDGRYTQAGLAKYKESLADKEKAKEKYKSMKKEGGYTKHELKRQKAKVKLANKQADRRYNLLKTDKLADKGRVRYEEGERILERNSNTRKIRSASGYTATAGAIAAKYPNEVASGISSVSKMLGLNSPNLNSQTIRTVGSLMVVGGGLGATAAQGKMMVDNHKNKQISAYYSHRYAR